MSIENDNNCAKSAIYCKVVCKLGKLCCSTELFQLYFPYVR